MPTISKVLYIKVGGVTVTKLENQKREQLVSGIKKYPVTQAYLSKTGFVNDAQADLLHHGGENKALFLFSKLTYEKINAHYNDSFDMTDVSYFGENIILDNVCEKDICVGDVLKIGETTVQITQPRQPCWKLSANTHQKDMTKFIFESGLTGFYAKVLKEGQIFQNDSVILEHRIHPNLTIEKLNELILNPLKDQKVMQEALHCEELGYQFKNSLQKRDQFKNDDTQFLTYHT
ncbi:MOSC domain-containing protein [Candidatus Marinarcus aquaticus]|uniref:MOSC domain-containing protein n=1 Tax=Candidatus Marinarcus aquaticus TaxID=2044504 RepID=A0A4Q0XT33_9BACT|nr:MOSC domain-containing protein [Candidatus Marinarcus aquaticus]RXJ57936.1 MOSC domain-containing protein [Candidatus Marinarcus aquaticus]